MKKKILISFIVTLSALFLLANIYFSQTLHPLFFKLVGQKDKETAILFLKKIKGQAEFEKQMAYFKRLYSDEIENQVYQDERKRKEEIKKLEQILLLNPKARDVLIKLAILYFEDGNFNKARQYYQTAKEVDPLLEIEELERLLNG